MQFTRLFPDPLLLSFSQFIYFGGFPPPYFSLCASSRIAPHASCISSPCSPGVPVLPFPPHRPALPNFSARPHPQAFHLPSFARLRFHHPGRNLQEILLDICTALTNDRDSLVC